MKTNPLKGPDSSIMWCVFYVIIFNQLKKFLLPYTSSQVAVSNSKLQDLYEAIPFPDKERYVQGLLPNVI